MVEFAGARIEIAPLFAVVRPGPGIEQMTDVGDMLRHRPASPPTMLRMVPPPRSGEGWRLARPVAPNMTVETRMNVRAALHPSPERGGGTMRSMVGGVAGRCAADFENAGHPESFSGESGHQTILPLFKTR